MQGRADSDFVKLSLDCVIEKNTDMNRNLQALQNAGEKHGGKKGVASPIQVYLYSTFKTNTFEYQLDHSKTY